MFIGFLCQIIVVILCKVNLTDGCVLLPSFPLLGTLQKERKLKDILRSGNCIVKRFQKHRERGDKMLMLVFAQVEVRLISRVLNMAKVTRDQVLWCHEKLDRINFVSRKIHVEPSFLLFPC